MPAGRQAWPGALDLLLDFLRALVAAAFGWCGCQIRIMFDLFRIFLNSLSKVNEFLALLTK